MKKYTLLLLFCCFAFPMWAQPIVNTIENKTINPLVNDKDNQPHAAGEDTSAEEGPVTAGDVMDELKRLRELIEAGQGAQVIATLQLRDTVTVFTKREGQISGETKTIDSIYIVAQGGFITDILVYIGDEVFTNDVLIGITKRRHYHNRDRLFNIGKRKYLYYQNAVLFRAFKSYVADDTNFTIRNTDNTEDGRHDFRKGNDLKTVLDLKLYTDALGVFANNPNGLVQVDASSKFMIHQSNISHRSAFILHNIKLNVNFAKFDSKQQYVTENDYSRSALLQKSWFNANLGINLFEGYVKQHYSTLFFIDAGGMINTSTLAKNNTDTVSITSTNIWGLAGVSVKGNDNYGVTASASVIFNYSPQTADIDFARNSPHVFFKPCIEAFYNPFGDDANRVFTKVTYWMDTWNISTQQNHFWQFQVGYNTTLSKLAKK